MGNLEKLVLLVLLFGAAVVLALTLNKSKAGGDSVSGPLDAAHAKLGERAGDVRAPQEPARGSVEEAQPGLLLNAGGPARAADERPSAAAPVAPAGLQSVVTPEATTSRAPEQESAVAPAAASDGRILKSKLGLEPSILDEYMVYTVAAGDTWAGLAQRFYQDGRYTRNLHLANEDLVELAPGAEILVPIYDFLQETGAEVALETAAAGEPTPTSGTIVPASSPRPSGMTSAAGRSNEYVVRSGDSLSEIALAVYGAASRWPEILEANQDQLSTPEQLQVGMKLRIPGEISPAALTALRTSAAEKPATKPAKTAKKPEVVPTSAKPKKKVQ